MPIIVHGDGTLTSSPKFDHEAFVWLEHPSIDPAEFGPALGLPAGATRPGPPGVEAQAATVWMCRFDPGADVGATLDGVTNRLTAAADFLTRVRVDGGRYGCLVLCHVDFNAGFALSDALLRRLGALRIDLTIHALDVETPATAAGRRRFLAIMNDPPWERRTVTEPAEVPEADPDEVS